MSLELMIFEQIKILTTMPISLPRNARSSSTDDNSVLNEVTYNIQKLLQL